MPRLFTTLAMVLLLALTGTAGERIQRHPENILRRTRRLLRMLESGEARRAPAAWQEHAAETLHLLDWTSTVPGGQMSLSQMPGGGELLHDMQSWTSEGEPLPEAESVREWIATFERFYRRGQRLSAPAPSREELNRARQVLQLELSRSAYAEAGGSVASLRQRLANLVARHVMDPLFGRRAHTARRALLAGCFVLLAMLLAHVIWELAQASRRSGTRREVPPRVTWQDMPDATRAPRHFLARGDAARKDGHYLQAMGTYYLALITVLAQAGCTSLDRSLTNGEHYRQSRQSGLLEHRQVVRLAEVTEFFDRRCYGAQTPSRDDAIRLRRQVTEFMDAV